MRCFSALIRGFRVELTFDAGEILRIPVEKDDFDLEHATVPAGLKLVRVR